jgi:hypothetical protein
MDVERTPFAMAPVPIATPKVLSANAASPLMLSPPPIAML